MYDYYCKNCNNLIGEWNNEFKFYFSLEYCNYFNSKNNEFMYFLDCKKCNKFVGIIYRRVCETCFGKDKIFGEKNLHKWFLKYKKTIQENLNHCKICDNKYYFRCQNWFFKELTFYK